MPSRRRGVVLAVLVLPFVVGLTGCTKTVRAGDVEGKIGGNLRQQLPGRTVTVDCPSGKKAEKGTAFACDVQIDGKPAVADVRLLTDEKFSFRMHSPDP